MNKIINLYEYLKNSPKKLKIICDWDEVIQATEPYAVYQVLWGKSQGDEDFPQFFKEFWWLMKDKMVYSPYGSRINTDSSTLEKQIQIKNSPNFYQEAPFLTIAEDLLKLIQEDKVERLIFLTAYDKRKFPNGDERKFEIFADTFKNSEYGFVCFLQLIPFESETQGQTKADWIKENASDFDIVIDDNPNICKSLVEAIENINKKQIEKNIIKILNHGNCVFSDCDKKVKREELAGFSHDWMKPWEIEKPICKKCWKECEKWIESKFEDYISLKDYLILVNQEITKLTIIAPYYPAIAEQHHSEVLLVKNEVSELKKEDFL